MKKIVTTLGLAAMAMSIAGSALALNPQPLPPRHVPHILIHRTHKPYVNHHRHHAPPPPKHHRHHGK